MAARTQVGTAPPAPEGTAAAGAAAAGARTGARQQRAGRAGALAPGAAARTAAAAALLLGPGVLVLALALGGGVEGARHGALGDGGAAVRWGLPLAQLALRATSAATAGLLLCAVALLPNPDAALSPAAAAVLRRCRPWALAWAASAAAASVLTAATVAGTTVPGALAALAAPGTWQAWWAVEPVRALLECTALAGVVALGVRAVRSHTAGWALLLAAGLALLPQALTGHVVHAQAPRLAAAALAVHVLGAATWTGGLLALVLLRRAPGPHLAHALPRYSRVALVCFSAVVLSGAVSAAVSLGSAGALTSTSWGRLVLLKTAAVLVLAAAGAAHRRWSVPQVLAGSRGAFARLGTAELLLMVVAVALAVALGRTPSP
ncbi:CopD family protein [Kineococcus sp. SYSU DK005]|uniref:CopD family protein n=1 Tax=Kineococcus sp. SYSU DK005 TaxID=3383126 RepID=UPI003D7CAF7E